MTFVVYKLFLLKDGKITIDVISRFCIRVEKEEIKLLNKIMERLL